MSNERYHRIMNRSMSIEDGSTAKSAAASF
jgi:hypothetical protein